MSGVFDPREPVVRRAERGEQHREGSYLVSAAERLEALIRGTLDRELDNAGLA